MGSAGSTAKPKVDFEKLDLYAVLQVSNNATNEELKIAYRKRALEHHPDKNQGDTEGATRRFARVQHAYETLKDENKRAEYDLKRFTQSSEPSGSSSTSSFKRSPEAQSEVPYWLIWLLGCIALLWRLFSPPKPAKDQFERFEPQSYASSNRSSFRKPGVSAVDILEYVSAVGKKADWTENGPGLSRYTLIRNIFECIAFDERQWGSFEHIPDFGCSHSVWSPAEDPLGEAHHYAEEFYNYWAKFQTRKTFEWVRPYSTNDPNFKERERQNNARAQAMARAEYNGIIVAIVDALRDGDPRYIHHLYHEAMEEMFAGAFNHGHGHGFRNRHGRHRESEPGHVPGRPAQGNPNDPHRQTRNQRKKQKQREKARKKSSW